MSRLLSMALAMEQVEVGIAIGSEIRGSATKDCLICAGPLSKQIGTMPFRIVLVRVGNELAVYTELFDTEGLPKPSFDHAVNDDVPESHLECGSYFRSDELVKAVQKFAERVERSATSLQSLYRAIQV